MALRRRRCALGGDLASAVPVGYMGYMVAGASTAGDEKSERCHAWPIAVEVLSIFCAGSYVKRPDPIISEPMITGGII